MIPTQTGVDSRFKQHTTANPADALDGLTTTEAAERLELPQPDSQRTAMLLGKTLRANGYQLFRIAKGATRRLEWHRPMEGDAP